MYKIPKLNFKQRLAVNRYGIRRKLLVNTARVMTDVAVVIGGLIVKTLMLNTGNPGVELIEGCMHV